MTMKKEKLRKLLYSVVYFTENHSNLNCGRQSDEIIKTFAELKKVLRYGEITDKSK